MAPERPGPEDEPGVTISAGSTLTIPVTLLSIPNTVLHIKVRFNHCTILYFRDLFTTFYQINNCRRTATDKSELGSYVAQLVGANVFIL